MQRTLAVRPPVALALLGILLGTLVAVGCVSGSRIDDEEDAGSADGATSCPNGPANGEVYESDPSCDGVDDDCDGEIDEDCPCENGGEPSDETCNGVDDDCDGEVDEELERECGESSGSCGVGTETCDRGEWSECKGGGKPVAEECNGFDDDCDGDTDELLERTCGTNDGVCTAGTETCNDGEWSECQGREAPEVENEEDENADGNLCDQKDNDCDGRTDENCSCESGASRACGTNEGECEKGTQSCGDDGTWGECTGQVGPQQEVCDNKDNDCNGQTDEGLQRECGTQVGVCQTGTEECVSGNWSNCDADMGTTERCDGRDNDCDGDTDEGQTQLCSNQTGVCQRSEAECQGGQYPTCSASQFGSDYESPEVTCGDGKDNDCDADTDCADSDCAGQQCAGDGTECQSNSCVETDCLDGKDNDGNGDTDCQDSECSCPSGTTCNSSTGACEEQDCADGLDNDSDNRTDCNDPDCDGLVCEENPCQDDGRIDTCSNGSCTTSGLICP